MSFSRLPYDDCAYTHKLAEAVSGNHYMLDTTYANHCKPCYVPSSTVRLQRNGARTAEERGDLADVSSDLFGLTRRSSHCPSEKYLPGKGCKQTTTKKLNECNDLDPEPSRLSNPPCTLKGRGIDRWDWLCLDPQAHTETPFPTDISTRMLAKDNHRPCVGRPVKQMMAKGAYNERRERCGANAPANPDNCKKPGGKFFVKV